MRFTTFTYLDCWSKNRISKNSLSDKRKKSSFATDYCQWLKKSVKSGRFVIIRRQKSSNQGILFSFVVKIRQIKTIYILHLDDEIRQIETICDTDNQTTKVVKSRRVNTKYSCLNNDKNWSNSVSQIYV